MTSTEGLTGAGNPWTEHEKSRIAELGKTVERLRSQRATDNPVSPYIQLLTQAGLAVEDAYYREGDSDHHFALVLSGAPLKSYEKAIQVNLDLQKQLPRCRLLVELKIDSAERARLLEAGFRPLKEFTG